MLSAVGFIREQDAATLWLISCAIGGHVLIAVGARAAGLAPLGAVGRVGEGSARRPGLRRPAHRRREPVQFAEVLLAQRRVGHVDVGRVPDQPGDRLALLQRLPPLQACGAYRYTRCLTDVDAGSLALFALDAAWVAGLCFIQAARLRLPGAIEPPVQKGRQGT